MMFSLEGHYFLQVIYLLFIIGEGGFMYNIIRESITAPKEIIKYHSKKGWFVFFYMLFFTILLSLDIIVLLIATNNPMVNEETTNCQVVDGSFECSERLIESQDYSAYGIPIYFLSDNQEITDITDNDYVIVVKDQSMTYRFGSTQFYQMDISSFKSVSDLYDFIKTTVVVPLIIATILQNILIIIFIVLISTLPFLRFRKEIRYKKIFKMVTFAATPIFIVLSINNLLELDMIIFFVVMFLAYRSIFVLQKELYVRSMMRKQKQYYEDRFHETDKDDIKEEDVIDQEEDDE